ncbi:MAG: methyltransferase domain-containing protein [Planctomycetota bacterium]
MSVRLPAFLHVLGRYLPTFGEVGPVVAVGSGTPVEVRRMLATVRRLFPAARVHLVAQPEARDGGVEGFTSLAEAEAAPWRTARALAAGRPDVGVILLDGQWQYWRQWLWACFVGARSYLVVNENGDAFFVRARDVGRLLRTLFRRRHGRVDRPVSTALVERLSWLLAAPAIAYRGLALEAGRRPVDPALALPRPGRLAPLLWLSAADGASGGAAEQGGEPPGSESGDAAAGAYTGERFVPGVDPDLEVEHRSRYAFARALARGRRVLDAGCGEGYGAAMLAEVAAAVTGVDVSAEAVARAAARYARPGLRFVEVGPDGPFPPEEGGYDLVTSFEVLEHVADPGGYLDRLAAAMAPGGLLVLSSPNGPYYRDERGEHNPYHVHEPDLDELARWLRARWRQVRVLGQNHVGGTLIGEPGDRYCRVEAAATPRSGELRASHYFVALCSDAELPAVEDLFYAGAPGNQLRDREQELALLRAEVLRAREAYARLEGEYEERSRWALELDQELRDLRHRIAELEERSGP